MRSIARILAVCAAVACAAAFSAATADDQYHVSPPDGWVQSSPDENGVLSVWGEPDPHGFRQNLNLISEPYHGTLSQYVRQNVASLSGHGSAIVLGPQADVNTCDTHPAHFISWKATIDGHPLVFEQVLSVWFDRAYVLTYTRETSQDAIDGARSALATLCVRQQ